MRKIQYQAHAYYIACFASVGVWGISMRNCWVNGQNYAFSGAESASSSEDSGGASSSRG